MEATTRPTGTPPPNAATLTAADRWRLWSSLVRGLSHQLANASQMLTLSDPPPSAIAESRERIAQAMTALQALRRGSGTGPTLLTEVLEDVERLQSLQMDFPSTTLALEFAPDVPALACRPDEAVHLLLGVATAFKEAAGDRRAEIHLEVRPQGEGALLALREHATRPAPEPAPGMLALVESLGGSLERRADGSLSLWLPAWHRHAPGA
ncbi:MAG: hypothetical protein HZA61_15360 [Candidatus Eisenbacteria bacterium]|uniref:Uncharacterized protein n=1 Tax=Eiseniibacteriota bacterium TaxID=2212470 RepID=A0A933SE33_UNCEI|nr:hypothetical protein [Candidatus Eisenbacteria bacterium]